MLPVSRLSKCYRITWALPIVMLTLAFSPLAHGQSLGEEVNTDQLSSKDFSLRQGAMLRLWQSGDVKEVEKALDSEDPEIRRRARWILDQRKLGISIDTPPSIARLLRGENSTEPISFESVVVSGDVEGLITAIDGPNFGTVRRRSQVALLRNFPKLTYLAIENGKTKEFDKLLAAMSYSPIFAICRTQLRAEMGIDPEACVVLSKSAQQMRPQERALAEIHGHWYVGLESKAIQIAKDTKSPILHSLLFSTEEWPQLIEVTDELAKKIELLESVESDNEYSLRSYISDCSKKIELLILQLYALHRENRAQEFDEVKQRIIDVLSSDQFHVAAEGLKFQSAFLRPLVVAAEALIAVDRPQEAIDLLSDLMPLKAAEMLVERAEYDRAFQVLGADLDNLDESLVGMADDAVRQAIGKKDPATLAIKPHAFDRCLAACNQAFHVGHGLAARTAMRKLARVRDDQSSKRMEVIEKVLFRGELEFAIELALPALGVESSDDGAAEALFRSSIGAGIWHALSEIQRSASTRDRAHSLIQLSLGKLPDGWTREQEMNTLAASLYEQVVGGDKGTNASRCNEAAEVLTTFGCHHWAEVFYRAAAETDYSAALTLAKLQYQQGRAEASAEHYEKLWERFSGHPESLVGWAKSLESIGQHDKARAIEDRLAMLVLSPEQYLKVAQEYLEFSETGAARDFASKVIRVTPSSVIYRSGVIDNYRAVSMLLGLEDSSTTDESIRLSQTKLERTLGSGITMINIATNSRIAFDVHLARAMAALEKGYVSNAEEHMQLALRQLPANIDFAENELVEVREQGHGNFADTVLDAIFSKTVEHLSKFPLHANMSNNAAWVASLHDRHLNEALEFSRIAVSLFPATFSYRDTLAEVLFRSGETEQAIQVESNCLLDVPDDYHLHNQLGRFRAE